MPHQPQLIPDQPAPDRAEYLEKLRERLKDPAFRQIEGIPREPFAADVSGGCCGSSRSTRGAGGG